MAYIKHIPIFIAYISDMEKEANECKVIQNNLNYQYESKMQIDLRTWKDVPEDFGNPQQKINKEFVEQCEIFIGIIGKKWGSPTGQSDCGFKEEFNIAEGRYNKTGKPSIWLYAKNINELSLNKEQKNDYLKVKEFKNEIISNHKGFLTYFKNKNTLRDQIQNRIGRFISDNYLAKESIEVELQ